MTFNKERTQKIQRQIYNWIHFCWKAIELSKTKVWCDPDPYISIMPHLPVSCKRKGEVALSLRRILLLCGIFILMHDLLNLFWLKLSFLVSFNLHSVPSPYHCRALIRFLLISVSVLRTIEVSTPTLLQLLCLLASTNQQCLNGAQGPRPTSVLLLMPKEI